MSGPTCLRCGRPLADGAYVCDRPCAAQAAQTLREIADLSPPCRDVANGLSRHAQGGASGKPGSRLPFDLTARAKLDGVSNAILGWARHVSESRGIELPTPPTELPNPMIGPLCRTRYECTHDSCKIMRDGDEWGWDAIAVSALFLADHLEWFRHRLEVDEFLTDVEAAARVLRSIARGPAEQKYLGPCGAYVITAVHNDEIGDVSGHECDGDVYGRPGARTGRCKTCGAEVDQGERQIWLDDVRREWLYHAIEIADAYPKINVNTIRSWLGRGLLVAHGEHDGRPLLKLGEVLDLAAGDAARREEARAARARRKEQAA